MLVLTRKVGEEIIIGNDIHVMLVAIQGDKVRLGVGAPKEVVVDSQEVHQKRRNSADEAVRPAPQLDALPAK
jgi:carbon storage regulator